MVQSYDIFRNDSPLFAYLSYITVEQTIRQLLLSFSKNSAWSSQMMQSPLKIYNYV